MAPLIDQKAPPDRIQNKAAETERSAAPFWPTRKQRASELLLPPPPPLLMRMALMLSVRFQCDGGSSCISWCRDSIVTLITIELLSKLALFFG